MLNMITLMGRLTRDPELRYTQSQKPVASFTLACERDTADKTADFIDIVAWNQTAEFVSKYFKKGDMAVASGRLQIREWTDSGGTKRKTPEIVVWNVYFGGKKDEPQKEEEKPKYTEPVDSDGELPF